MKKRLLSLLLTLAMVLTLAPVAFAAGDDNTAQDADSTEAVDTVQTAEAADAGEDASQETADDSIDAQATNVAQIGDTAYATLAKAIKAATDGEIVQLIADTNISNLTSITITKKNITLDLNGYSIKASNSTSKGHINIYGATLTLMDSTDTNKDGTGTGKIYTETKYTGATTTNCLITAQNGGHFVMESGLIDAASFTTDSANEGQFAVGVYNTNSASKASATINGGHIKAGWYAIAGNGVSTNGEGNITVNGGIVESVADYAIYQPQPKGMTIINGGVVYGAAGGIAVKCGKVQINGGIITSKGTGNTGNWGDGTGGLDAAAVNVDAAYGDSSVEITGGTFIAENNALFIKNNTHNGTISVSGGTFSSDVSGYLASGCELITNEDGTCTVEDHNVAKIGEVEYMTLQEAIDEAKSGETVKLLNDVTEDITVSAGQNLTLDLNGHKITNASGHTITVESGAALTITGEGTVDNITHAKAAIVNYGTVTLNGGTYTRSKEDAENNKDSAGKNSYYTILNDKGGNMTINAGVTVTNVGHFSSMIRNGGDEKSTTKSVLTINGGTFSGGLNTVKNDELGELTITGGNFSNTSQYVIMNWNKATISGGSFATNDTAEAVLFSVAYLENRAVGELTITGGSFTGSASQAMIANTYGAAYSGTASVSGGMFSGKVDDEFLADDFEAVLVNGMYQVQKEKLDNPNEYELILTPDKRHVSAGDEIKYTVTLKHTKGDSAQFGFLRITPQVDSKLLEFAEFEKSENNSAGVKFNNTTGQFWFISSGENGCALAEGGELAIGTLTYKVKGYKTDQTAVVAGKTDVEDEDGCDQITNPGYNEGAKVTVNAGDVTYHVIEVTFKQDDNTANDKLFYAPYDNTGLYGSLEDLENRTNKQDAPKLSKDSTGGTKYRLKDADWHKDTATGEVYTAETKLTADTTYVTNRVDLVKVTPSDKDVVEIPPTDKQVVTEREDGTYVDKENDLTFTVGANPTPGKKYEVTVTVNGAPVEPEQNTDGSYTVKGSDVTGDVEITVKSVLDLEESDIYIFTDGEEGTEAYAYLPYSTYSGEDTLVLIKGKTGANYTLDAGQPTIYRTDAYKAAVGEGYTHAVLIPKASGVPSKDAMLKKLMACGLTTSTEPNKEINIASWDTNGNNNEKRDLGDVQAANDFKTLKDLKWTPSDDLLLLADVVTLPKGSTDADKYNDTAYTKERDGHVSDDDVSAFVYRYAKLG